MLTSKSRLPLVHYELAFDGDLTIPWEVRHVTVNEALNASFDATIEAATIVNVDADTLLGASASLTIARGDYQHEPRQLFGIVEQIDDLGGSDHEHHLRFVLVPAFALLRQRLDSRIWQHGSVLDIIDEVLGPALAEYGRTYKRGAVTRGTQVRDYCVQYRESDHDYVCRLLEEEGISYAFVHDPERGHEILSLFDANEQYPALVSDDDDDRLPIILHNPEDADVESIQAIAWSRALTSTAALRRDFDWREPEQLLTREASGRDARSLTRRLFVHTDRRFITDDLAERAGDLQRASALVGAVCRGHGNATVLSPGLRFTLTGHVRADLERAYIVTAVHHCGDIEGAQYTNEFECVPDNREIRPQLQTPKPRIFGPQTAIVTGEDEIHTDDHGRVEVQFHWEQRASYMAGSSCWIRCAQSWSGAGWGAHFIPRVGMEVVIEFLEGNPDCPLITGCVYNGSRPHPFTLPDAKTQSGWRTRSSPASEGFNELRFEDAAGREEIYVHGQRDWTSEIENNTRHTIGHDRSVSVGNNHTTKVGNSRSLSVSNTDTVSVGAAQSVSIGAAQSVSVGGGRSVSVGGGLSISNAAAYSHSSGGAVSVSGGTTGSISMAEELTISCGAASIRLKQDGEIEVAGKAISVVGVSLAVVMELIHSSTAHDTIIHGNKIKLNPPPPAADKTVDELKQEQKDTLALLEEQNKDNDKAVAAEPRTDVSTEETSLHESFSNSTEFA